MPKISSADAALFAAKELIHALENPAPASPLAPLGLAQLQALRQLATIFDAAIKGRQTTRSPRVDNKTNATFPRLNTTETTGTPPPHRYPTRQQLASQHSAHHVATIDSTPLLHDHTPPPVPPHYAHSVVDPETGTAMEYRHLIQKDDQKKDWEHSFANELGRLAQGIKGRVKHTDTIFFISRDAVPKDRTVTYGRIVVSIRPQKDEPLRTRLTVGGNLIDYPGDVSTPTADLVTAKILFNSVVSTPDAKLMCCDVKNFYLCTPMERYEYMRLPIALIPPEIIDAYNLRDLVHNGYVYIEIRKGMYGLPQAGILANQLLTKRLAVDGYYPTTHTPGLFRHRWRPIIFSLVVDDFGVQYTGTEHANHLVQTLKKHYTISEDWAGTLYCGLTLAWDYRQRTVDVSMPGYISNALHKFQHPPPRLPQHAPYKWSRPNYGATIQLTDPIDKSPALPPNEIKRLQQVVGTLLYYARAVDSTMLAALGTLSSAQTKGTTETAAALVQLLNYCATHPDATIRYRASDMVLHIDSDASYLSEPEARSRAGGHFFLSNTVNKPSAPNNGAILTISNILRHVMSSAAEAECGALFLNAKEGTVIRTTLEEMGYPQPPTPLKTDNSTADGIANDTIKQRRSRAIDMRFYWVRCRVNQGQFRVFWAPGKDNLADYFTKHHAPSHHRTMRPQYLQESNIRTQTPARVC
jgi:hypothetical protein